MSEAAALARAATPGAQVLIDGRRFTVAKVLDMGLQLRGPRGAGAGAAVVARTGCLTGRRREARRGVSSFAWVTGSLRRHRDRVRQRMREEWEDKW